MAFARNHAFVSGLSDGADTSLVRPSNWNAAFVVSGATSGGIPYFDSATSEACSALLAQYGVITGGGVGAAPYTTSGFTYGATVAGRLIIAENLQSTGWRTGTASTDLQFTKTTGIFSFPTWTLLLGNATAGAVFNTNYAVFGSGTDGSSNASIWINGDSGAFISLASGSRYAFSSSSSGAASNLNTVDTAISRLSAGVIAIGTGASSSFAGRSKLTSEIFAGVAIGSLNASPTTGEIQSVTDALAPAAGAAVAAGGAAKALVWWNGAQWTVIGV